MFVRKALEVQPPEDADDGFPKGLQAVWRGFSKRAADEIRRIGQSEYLFATIARLGRKFHYA